jgi:hypothetical protein
MYLEQKNDIRTNDGRFEPFQHNADNMGCGGIVSFEIGTVRLPLAHRPERS